MARAKKAYQPIDDDIDGEVEKPSVMDTAVDVLQQAVHSMVITEEEVLQADREARSTNDQEVGGEVHQACQPEGQRH